LVSKGSPEDGLSQTLWTEAGFKDFRLIVDWRFTGEPVAKSVPVILPDGSRALDSDGQETFVPIRYAGEGKILLRGSEQSGIIMTTWPEGSGGLAGYREDGVLDPDTRKLSTPILRADKATGEWNRFEITVIGDQLNVVLNDRQVIRNASIPGISETGIIGIQTPDFPMEFANIYILEL
jgi:hypothetical protein